MLRRKHWRENITLFSCRIRRNDSIQDFLHGLEQTGRSSENFFVLTRKDNGAEDFWTFNSEALIHKITNCSRSSISIIGHKTNFAPSDFTADLRAETSSSAAKIIARFLQNAL
jgi:exonuclease VII large subunit